MPVFDKAVSRLAHLAEPMPDLSTLPRNDTGAYAAQYLREQYWRDGEIFEKYRVIFEELIDSIDWNRVQLEASGRCLAYHGKTIKDDIDIPCGDCLMQAMLERNTFPRYLGATDEELEEGHGERDDSHDAA